MKRKKASSRHRHPRRQKNNPWQRIVDDVKAKRSLSHDYGHCTIPGTKTIEVRHSDIPFPLGIVWFAFCKNNTEVEIQNSFVFEKVRRCGIRRMLNDVIFRYPSVKRIVTGGATESGEAFMRATGYRKNKDGWWELSRK